MNVSFSRKIKYAGAALLAVSTLALATVTFDPVTGTGFVGKGDVQILIGWNNQQLQANASGITFSYNSVDTYDATCAWVTGEGTRGEQHHTVSIPRHTGVNNDITYSARIHSQIDGFTLTGLGTTVVIGSVPVVGDVCVGDDGSGIAQNGTWSSVDLASTDGGLFFNYDGNPYLLQ